MSLACINARKKSLLIACIFSFFCCEYTSAEEMGEMPPAAVGVVKLSSHSVPVVNELPGRIAATRISEVRARVSGILQERVFEQGVSVKRGDVLYRIDPSLFRVRIASAEASLNRAKAARTNAGQQLERQKTLRQRNVSAGVEFDTATVNLAQAEADVQLAKAALDEAKINLDYTEVRAPISGIIGGALVTEGALVTADGGTNLALIQQVDPVYADFTQSAQQLLDLKRAVASGKLASRSPGEMRVELVFDDGTVYAHPGRLLFASANVDPNTGQVTLRAEFPNPKSDLLPGMYVRVRIEQAVRENTITIPQRAVTRDENGRALVYVVSGENEAKLRPISLGKSLGSEWVVEEGLKDGETIVVDGVQKVAPGATVIPEPWQPSPTNSNQASE